MCRCVHLDVFSVEKEEKIDQAIQTYPSELIRIIIGIN